MVSLYLDHHVDFAIAEGLRLRGIDVLTCQEDGTAHWDDERLLDRAQSLGRVIFSKDSDFLAIAQKRQQERRDFAGVAYAHQLHISIGQAIRDLELLAKVFDLEDMRNRVEFLPYS